MKIATALTFAVDAEQQASQLTEHVRAALGGRSVDACLVFASAHFEDCLDRLALELHEHLQPRTMIGATAEAVIGDDHEYEGRPALVVWAAHLPGTRFASFHLSREDIDRLDAPAELRDHLAVPDDARPYFVLLAEPFSFHPTPTLLTLLARLHEACPGRPVIGGLASAGEAPGQNRLIFDGHTLRHGAAGIALWGNIHVDTVVSQGCRPIGRHMTITRAEQNVIYELGGQPPLQVFKRLLLDIAPHDRQLLQKRGLLVGCAIKRHKPEFTPNDFLIRHALGFDESSGAMAVNDLITAGQTVQFHVRDGRSASQDLHDRLSLVRDTQAAGALLFTCNGRGTHLFDQRDHDARTVSGAVTALPLAGFFCAGEIGPVADRNYLHGHTASIGFFRPATLADHA